MSWDALLLLGFGGPTRPEEIRPFLAHVLRGRPVPASRLEEVAHHYEVIGGRSPINELTERQRAALETELRARGIHVPVALGMRHAQPFVADVLRELVEAGARRLRVVIMAAFHDSATVERYAAAVSDAAAQLSTPLELRYCEGVSASAGFVRANAEHIRAAYARLPEGGGYGAASGSPVHGAAELIFTAHSVPTPVGEQSGYIRLFEAAAAQTAAELGIASYRLAYQSRSGAPRDPWLEPDICSVIRDAAARGQRALVVAPIGFVCDHVEVLYDLDVEAAQVAAALGVTLSRASTVNDHPAYIQALADEALRILV